MTDSPTNAPWLVTMIGSGKLSTDTDGDGYYLPDENMDCDQRRVDTARLVAAAPSLLAELVKIKQTIENSDEWWMDDPHRGGFDLAAIDDAIALARGGK